ncbi:MAG: M67 family metallopeptidase [Actinomycetota bacterium]|nr:M67 family metallopeptidase [Actinomycetota bacterium]
MEVPPPIREAMVAHARFCFPEEACGLLAADQDGRLRMAYCLTNIEHSPTTFTLDPTEHFRALKHAERLDWHLAGVFHSHTHTAPYPSPRDVALANEPHWLYLIVGLADWAEPSLGGYWIREGKVLEEPLVVTR